MRALLVLIVLILAAGGALLYFSAPPERLPEVTPSIERPGESAPEPGAPSAIPDLPAPPPAGPIARDTEALPPAATVPHAPFHGQALLQRPGEPPYPAAQGRIEFEVIHRGRREPMTAKVLGGRFDVGIPEIGRVRIQGGELEGEPVRFPGSEALFDPTDEDYVLVGEPVPSSVLEVTDGLSGAPLAGVTIRRGDDATAARLVAEAQDPVPEPAPARRALVEDGASPITLPWLDAGHAIWLHLQKDGYAPASVLVEPNREARRKVVMWPSATLTVRVIGPGRARLNALVLLREEGEGRTPHAATFSLTAPGVRQDPDALVFEIEGLAALPHRIQAKGYDGRGRAVDLGETRVELVPGRPGLATLQLEAR